MQENQSNNEVNNDDAKTQTDNLNALGFDTNLAKRSIIIAFISFLVLLLGYSQNIHHKEIIAKNQRIEALETQLSEKNNEYNAFLKEQIVKQENHKEKLQEQMNEILGLKRNIKQIESTIK